MVLAYRSAETITPFVDSLIACLEADEPDWELVLVGNYFADTGDNTPLVVADLAQKNPRILAVTKVKEGMMGWDKSAKRIVDLPGRATGNTGDLWQGQ